jgi:hypothetical protein
MVRAAGRLQRPAPGGTMNFKPVFAVSILFCFATACQNQAVTIDSDQLTRLNDDSVAWSANDSPSVLDLDESFTYTYADLPLEGAATNTPWAGNYWPTYRDSINYRWAGPDALSPTEKFAQAFSKTGLTDAVSEYYGIDSRKNRGGTVCTDDSVCDSDKGEKCSKRTGAEEGVCVETWFGICHAWAPVALMEPEPRHAITYNGVDFTVNDLKALVTLSYDKGLKSKLMSGRCNAVNSNDDEGIQYDQYGRPELDDALYEDCADTNPGSFHVVVTNMLGIQGKGIVEDRTFDYEVWNQPVRAYKVMEERTVTEQEANELIGASGEDYIFNIEATDFKYVKTALNWITESHQETDGNLASSIDNYTKTDTYEYVLELDRNGAIIGGEWIGDSKQDHPDFLWIGVEKEDAEVAIPNQSMASESGILGQGAWQQYGPYPVAEAERIRVLLQGTEGDADLYVRFAEAPTTSSFHCRPYKNGSNEECSLTTPDWATQIFVGVQGAATSNPFSLTVGKQVDGTGIQWAEVKTLLEMSLVDPPEPEEFNWGEACEAGSGSFETEVAAQAEVEVGPIPTGKHNVRVSLTSSNDVDIRLSTSSSDYEIIAWPNGDLKNAGANDCAASNASSTSGGCCVQYVGADGNPEDIQYCYSGYYGDGTNYGHEWAEVRGTTNRGLTMSVFGYAAGTATVNYSWEAPPDCVDVGQGEFNRTINAQSIVPLGTVPEGKRNVKIELVASGDLDIQLFDGETALVKWPDGELNGPSSQELSHRDMNIHWSGYEGTSAGPGAEYIVIQGDVTADLQMLVYGYEAGEATVTYSWGLSDEDIQAALNP